MTNLTGITCCLPLAIGLTAPLPAQEILNVHYLPLQARQRWHIDGTPQTLIGYSLTPDAMGSESFPRSLISLDAKLEGTIRSDWKIEQIDLFQTEPTEKRIASCAAAHEDHLKEISTWLLHGHDIKNDCSHKVFVILSRCIDPDKPITDQEKQEIAKAVQQGEVKVFTSYYQIESIDTTTD